MSSKTSALDPRRDPAYTATLLFAIALVGYAANGRTIWSWDTLPARYLPLSLLRHASFYLDDFPILYAGNPPWAYGVQRVEGHYVAIYPVGGPLLALPFYAPSALASRPVDDARAEALEKVSAAAIVSLSVALLYLALLEVTSHGMALGLALAYAFGTSSFSLSSQALWQHGPSQLALAAALLSLARGRMRPSSSRWIAAAGFALAYAVICRPSNLVVAAPLGVYAVISHPRHIASLLAGALPPALFQVWYKIAYLGDLWSTHFALSNPHYWQRPSWARVEGLLFSPSRGLFVYSPIFLFSIAALAASWRRGGDPLLRAIGAGVVLTIALYSKWRLWWAGTVYGPRYLADLSPILVFGLYPLRDLLLRKPALRAVFALVLLWSVLAHSIGAFLDDGVYSTAKLWSWSDNQLVNPIIRLARRL